MSENRDPVKMESKERNRAGYRRKLRMNQAKVVEIGPRDGFQNVKEQIPTEVKLNIIDGIIDAGFKKVQIGSFVSPKAIPQMRDMKEITAKVIEKYGSTGVEFFALVPNLFGAKAAWEAGLREITPVMSLSESHNMNNVKRTKEQSIEEIAKIRQELPDIKITQDIATVFGCPFEGEIKSLNPLLELVGKLHDLGIHAFTLCDTVGLSYPKLIIDTLDAVKKSFPEDEFNIHIHDTRNMGIMNSWLALEHGADSVQTTLGGLGGCPFAPGASGNTATEDLIYALNKNGVETGIDFDKLLKIAKYEYEQIPTGNFSGHQIKVPEHPCIIRQE